MGRTLLIVPKRQGDQSIVAAGRKFLRQVETWKEHFITNGKAAAQVGIDQAFTSREFRVAILRC